MFKELTLIGSTKSNFYIHFTCDGLATSFWGVQLSPSEEQFDLEKFQPPIHLQTDVYTLITTNNYSTEVVEGEKFPVPVVIQVQHNEHNLTGK